MRRFKRYKEQKKSKIQESKKIGIVFVFFVLMFVILSFIFFKVLTLDKFIYVNRAKDSSAEVIIIDSKNDKNIKYLISADTELDSSRNLGDYKVSSLWTLGQKEGYNGKLIAETISKNYLIPLYLWKDDEQSSPLLNKRTNLSIFQRIKTFLVEKRLTNYTSTFGSKKLPNSILVNFVDLKMSEGIVKVDIEDLTGSLSVAEDVSQILEIMGGKITSNSKGYDENLDCEVIGKDKVKVKIVSSLFGCKPILDESLAVDLKLRLGAVFANRF